MLGGLCWFFAVIVGYMLLIIPGLVLHLCCIFFAASGEPYDGAAQAVVASPTDRDNGVTVCAGRAVTSGGIGTVILVFAVALFAVFAVAIVAATAVPGLLRARIAGNEASAIGTLRSISSAETAYAASLNGGYYDSQSCLVRPGQCVTGFQGTAFLAEEYLLRSGYRFELAGEPSTESKPGTSPSSLRAFAVMAIPVSSSTGTRVFCVDDSGALRSNQDGRAVPSHVTSCPTSWAALQ